MKKYVKNNSMGFLKDKLNVIKDEFSEFMDEIKNFRIIGIIEEFSDVMHASLQLLSMIIVKFTGFNEVYYILPILSIITAWKHGVRAYDDDCIRKKHHCLKGNHKCVHNMKK